MYPRQCSSTKVIKIHDRVLKSKLFQDDTSNIFPNGIIRGHFESQYNSACFSEIGSRQCMLVVFILLDPGYISYIC